MVRRRGPATGWFDRRGTDQPQVHATPRRDQHRLHHSVGRDEIRCGEPDPVPRAMDGADDGVVHGVTRRVRSRRRDLKDGRPAVRRWCDLI